MLRPATDRLCRSMADKSLYLGWFGAADLQKAFGPDAQGSNVAVAAKRAAIVWVTGIPVGLSSWRSSPLLNQLMTSKLRFISE